MLFKTQRCKVFSEHRKHEKTRRYFRTLRRKGAKKNINVYGLFFYSSTGQSQVKKCLEDNTMSNPVHTSETRMCGD